VNDREIIRLEQFRQLKKEIRGSEEGRKPQGFRPIRYMVSKNRRTFCRPCSLLC